MISRKAAPSPNCVLIVDRSEDSREVLQTALERRGLRTLTTNSAQAGLQLARSHRPQVIVLDTEGQQVDEACVRDQYDSEVRTNNSSLVILSTARRQTRTDPPSRFVAKPYHYAPLIRTIEQLLKQSCLT